MIIFECEQELVRLVGWLVDKEQTCIMSSNQVVQPVADKLSRCALTFDYINGQDISRDGASNEHVRIPHVNLVVCRAKCNETLPLEHGSRVSAPVTQTLILTDSFRSVNNRCLIMGQLFDSHCVYPWGEGAFFGSIYRRVTSFEALCFVAGQWGVSTRLGSFCRRGRTGPNVT